MGFESTYSRPQLTPQGGGEPEYSTYYLLYILRIITTLGLTLIHGSQPNHQSDGPMKRNHWWVARPPQASPLNRALGQPTVKPTVTFYNYALSELPMTERIIPHPLPVTTVVMW